MAETYTLEVLPPRPGSKSYQWAIRRNGRMYQRSDRQLETHEKARRQGELILDRLKEGRPDLE